MKVNAKCNDLVHLELDGYKHDGYMVAGFGLGAGDYLIFDICLGCGTVQGHWPNDGGIDWED